MVMLGCLAFVRQCCPPGVFGLADIGRGVNLSCTHRAQRGLGKNARKSAEQARHSGARTHAHPLEAEGLIGNPVVARRLR